MKHNGGDSFTQKICWVSLRRQQRALVRSLLNPTYARVLIGEWVRDQLHLESHWMCGRIKSVFKGLPFSGRITQMWGAGVDLHTKAYPTILRP